jgi:hypothetical protein
VQNWVFVKEGSNKAPANKKAWWKSEGQGPHSPGCSGAAGGATKSAGLPCGCTQQTHQAAVRGDGGPRAKALTRGQCRECAHVWWRRVSVGHPLLPTHHTALEPHTPHAPLPHADALHAVVVVRTSVRGCTCKHIAGATRAAGAQGHVARVRPSSGGKKKKKKSRSNHHAKTVLPPPPSPAARQSAHTVPANTNPT